MFVSVFMLSTPPKGVNSFFSRLIKLKDKFGIPVANVYALAFICSHCKKLMTGAEDCTHMLTQIPPWKEVLSRFSCLYEQFPEVHQAENLGFQAAAGSLAIHPSYLEAFRQLDRVNIGTSQVKIAIVTVDPSGCGKGETACVCLLFMSDGNIVIAGLDSYATTLPEADFQLISCFLEALRAHPLLCNAWFLYCIENNTGKDTVLLDRLGSTINKCVSMHQKPPLAGWRTGNDEKIMYLDCIKEALSGNRIRFMDDFICENVFWDNMTEEQRREKAMREFFEELERIRDYTIQPTQPGEKPKRVISGKYDEKMQRNPLFNDDKFVAFGMALFLWKMFQARKIENVDYEMILSETPPDNYYKFNDIPIVGRTTFTMN